MNLNQIYISHTCILASDIDPTIEVAQPKTTDGTTVLIPSTLNEQTRKDLYKLVKAGSLEEIQFSARVFRPVYPNSNFVRFRNEDMATFSNSFSGQPFLQDHDTRRIASRLGTITNSDLDNSHDIIQKVTLTTQDGMLAFVEGRIDRFSIGWYYSGLTCSVCNEDWLRSRACNHWPGSTYEVKDNKGREHQKLCEIIFETPLGKETSAVNAPAVQGTELLNALHDLAEHKNSRYRRHQNTENSTMDPQNATQTIDQDEDEQELSAKEVQAQIPTPTDQQDNITLTKDERLELETLRATFNKEHKATTPQAADPQPQQTEPNPQQSNGTPPLDQWQQAAQQWNNSLRDRVVNDMLSASSLNEQAVAVIRKQLQLIGDYTPDDVTTAINEQKAAIAKALDAHVVKDLHPVSTVDQMTTGFDQLSNNLQWAFGVSDASMPKPNERKLADMYLYITGDFEWRGEFDPQWSQLANANTGTFTGMAVNALNKVVQMHYDNQKTYKWFEPIVEVLPHDGSTHDLQLIMVDGIGVLADVNEGAPYLEAEVGDSLEVLSFQKRGHYVGITLEMIRRSDIAKIRAIPKALVSASCRTRSGAIASIFTQNNGVGPTMKDDNVALFHSNHNNILSAAFGAAAWADAREATWKQKLPGTNLPVSLWPRFALLPIDLYDPALKIFGMGAGDVGKPTSGGNAQEVNPYAMSRQGDPRPIPIAVPEFTDSNNWATVTDPMEHAPLKMAYANSPGGMEHPMPELYQVRSQTAGLMFTNDVLPIKIRDWFGFAASTHVGLHKNNVP